jgi:hypothetical protein
LIEALGHRFRSFKKDPEVPRPLAPNDDHQRIDAGAQIKPPGTIDAMSRAHEPYGAPSTAAQGIHEPLS